MLEFIPIFDQSTKILKRFENANDCPQNLGYNEMKAEIVKRAYQSIRDETLDRMFEDDYSNSA